MSECFWHFVVWHFVVHFVVQHFVVWHFVVWHFVIWHFVVRHFAVRHFVVQHFGHGIKMYVPMFMLRSHVDQHSSPKHGLVSTSLPRFIECFVSLLESSTTSKWWSTVRFFFQALKSSSAEVDLHWTGKFDRAQPVEKQPSPAGSDNPINWFQFFRSGFYEAPIRSQL
jgi:hypothetical protein